MQSATLEEVQAHLPEILGKLGPGEEIAITVDGKPVGKLSGGYRPAPRRLGTLKGTVLRVTSDFDAPLADFTEYME